MVFIGFIKKFLLENLIEAELTNSFKNFFY